MKHPEFIPLGRLSEVAARPDAELYAYTVQGFDAKITRFNSREQVRAFCKAGSRMFAVMKQRVESENHITNRNFQTA